MSTPQYWASRGYNYGLVEIWKGEKPTLSVKAKGEYDGNQVSELLVCLLREDFVALFGFNMRKGCCVAIIGPRRRQIRNKR